MKESPAIKARAQRLKQLLEAIRLAKPSASMTALIDECFEKLNISPKLTMEYLKELEQSGMIKIEGDDITAIKKEGAK